MYLRFQRYVGQTRHIYWFFVTRRTDTQLRLAAMHQVFIEGIPIFRSRRA